jgi:hypothetical protein
VETNSHGRPALADEPALIEIRDLLNRGRSAPSVVLEGSPTAGAGREQVHPNLSDEAFHRLWTSALFYRTLDAFEATALLWEAALNTEAAAHCRIGFEHLVAFAWVIAAPGDLSRPMAIAKQGTDVAEKQRMELQPSDGEPSEGWLAISFNANNPPLPPSVGKRCVVLDAQLVPLVPGLNKESSRPFTTWYSYIFRGASGLVHPSPAGLVPLVKRVSGEFVVAPSTEVSTEVLKVVTDQLRATLLIAKSCGAWLGSTGPDG